MKYQYIVFDVDGTLIDTERTEVKALQQALRETMGQNLPYDALKSVFGTTGRIGLKNLGYSPEEVDKIYPRWYTLSVSSIGQGKLFPGIAELLERLIENGYQLGVVTSRAREEYELGAKENRFDRYFKQVICQEDTEKHKPDAAPLLAYLQRAGAQAAQTLYVGDSRYDMACAHAAGVDSALALWGTQEPKLPARYYIRYPEELIKILQEKRE